MSSVERGILKSQVMMEKTEVATQTLEMEESTQTYHNGIMEQEDNEEKKDADTLTEVQDPLPPSRSTVLILSSLANRFILLL